MVYVQNANKGSLNQRKQALNSIEARASLVDQFRSSQVVQGLNPIFGIIFFFYLKMTVEVENRKK